MHTLREGEKARDKEKAQRAPVPLNDKVKRSGRRNAHAAQLQTLKNLPWATPKPKRGRKRTKSLRARDRERKGKYEEEEEQV